MTVDKHGNPIVSSDDTVGGTSTDGKTPPTDGEGKSKDDDKKGGNKDDLIPSYRLREETEKRREAEAKVSEYEKKESERQAKAKRKEEEDALKNGEHEKVISQKDKEINSYKEKEKGWEEKTKSIQKLVDQKLEDFKSKFGEEKLAKVKNMIGSDNPRIILEKIDDFASFMVEQKPSGGTEMPKGGEDNSILNSYKEKLAKGERLSAKEEKHYIELIADKND